MRLVTLALLLCVSKTSCLQVGLLYSSFTPFNISEVLQLCPSATRETVPILISTRRDIDAVSVDVVFDYLYDETLSGWAGAHSADNVKMWAQRQTVEYGREVVAYLQALNFSRVMLVADTSASNAVIVETLYAQYSLLFRDFAIIPKTSNITFALQFVGKIIKARGMNIVAFFVTPQTALSFMQALEIKKLDKAGCAFILTQEAARYRYLIPPSTGLLGRGVLVVGEEAEVETTREAQEARRLGIELQLLLSQEQYKPTFNLLYMNNSKLVIAASTPQGVSPSTKLLFPGASTTIPRIAKAVIRTAVNYQVINPDLSVYPQGNQMMRGFKVAFDEANNRTDMFPDYILEDHSVGFMGLAFSYNFSLSRVKAGLKDLGLIFMCPPTTVGITGMTKIFTDLNLTIPIVAGSLGSPLSDPKTYPLYIRPRIANTYLMAIVARMIKFFGWSKIAVIYAADSGDYQDAYNQFLKVKDQFGITITNPEDKRTLPAILNNSTAALVNTTVSDIMQFTTRIVLIMHSYAFTVMEQMYDLGIRQGYVQLYVSGLNDATYKSAEFFKRRAVSKGALMFFPSLFVGPTGQRVKQELMKRDGAGMFSNTCFFYDASYLYFYATQMLLEHGKDYEDPLEIVKAMRETYFHGCSGFIKIDSGSNDRAASEVAITNFQYDPANDTYVLKVVGAYNPFSIQPYQITSPVQWPDDSATYADTKPNYLKCPYLEELVRDIYEGKVIGLGVDFAIACLTLVITVLIWRRWWNIRIKVLTKKEPIMTEDVLVLFTVLCDYFQFAAVGPNLADLSHFMMTISASVGYDMDKLINISQGIYWVVLDVALALVFAWTTLCFLKFTRLDAVITKLWSGFEYWTDLLMPTLGNLLFLPIVSTLTNVFLCFKSTSASLKDSFLNKDCFERCWSSKHLGYVVGSGLGLLCYIPLAVFTRPLWQQLQPNLHVKAEPLGLMVKSAVQVFLIVASNTLKESNPSTHAYLFFTVVFVYICFMLRVRQYNYDRLNMWQVILMVAMLSLSTAGHITSVSGAYSTYLIIVLLVEYCVLASIGLLLGICMPRFGVRLVRERRKDVRGLFVFAFTGGKRAQQGLEQFYTANVTTLRKVSASEGNVTKHEEVGQVSDKVTPLF